MKSRIVSRSSLDVDFWLSLELNFEVLSELIFKYIFHVKHESHFMLYNRGSSLREREQATKKKK